MQQSLMEKLTEFLPSSSGSTFTIDQIPGGASSRRYYKMQFTTACHFPSKTVLLMTIPSNEKTIIYNWINIHKYFQLSGIDIPGFFEINEKEGWIFLEYLELPTLENYLHHHPEKTEQIISALIEHLIVMQKKCIWDTRCRAFKRRFDYEKYMFEFDFHVQEQLLGSYYRCDYDKAILKLTAIEISQVLDIEAPIFVHRDFQSSNIFIDVNNSPLAFKLIDFQDARHGLPIYDLVSCLWDSYLKIDDALQQQLVERYYQQLPKFNILWDKAHYDKLIDYAIIQRKLHDAGAFANNLRRFGDKKYEKYISQAIRMALVPLSKYRQFSGMVKILEGVLKNQLNYLATNSHK